LPGGPVFSTCDFTHSNQGAKKPVRGECLTIANDGENLCVTYHTTDTWFLTTPTPADDFCSAWRKSRTHPAAARVGAKMSHNIH
jgi:hypothetical protein